MGDDGTVQARPRLPRAALGDLGGDQKKPPSSPQTSVVSGVAASRFSRTRGDGASPCSGTPPGTALERKKSYHPELLEGCPKGCPPASAGERRDMFVLPRDDLGLKMELIHLNRTCTSVDLASTAASSAAASSGGLTSALRRASDANLTDEEKVHRVRHQVSFAQDVGAPQGPQGRPAFEDLARALRCRAVRPHRPHLAEDEDAVDEDDALDGDSLVEEEQDDDALNAGRLSPDSDADCLAVRPSLASTQLNGLRGPH